jgi:chromosomal replication initiator protein
MDLKSLWLTVISDLSKEVKRADIITWFRNTALLRVEGNTAVIGLPLPVFLQWHLQRYYKQTLAALKTAAPEILAISYEVDVSLKNETDPRVVDLLKHFPEQNSARKLPNRPEARMRSGLITKILSDKYTLDNFVVSPENRLAHAACHAVAKNPGQNYNPLFIYGGVGLGKTHLLQATGNEALKIDPTKSVLYTTTESFVNEVIDAIQKRTMDSLRGKYRKLDILIMDDIQFLADKERCQEEFFHTFNDLILAGKQIILSSDRQPHELKSITERLVSRFESGMTVQVQMPDFETRLSILQSKCQKAQAFIQPEVLQTLACEVPHSIRALEGTLTRILAQYELEQIAPTVKSVQELMNQGQAHQEVRAPRAAVTLDSLMDLVSEYYKVSKEDLKGDSRLREIMIPRQVVMYLAKKKLSISLVKIGEQIGNRNHTTVMHAIEKLSEQIKNDAKLLRDINAIVREAGLIA